MRAGGKIPTIARIGVSFLPVLLSSPIAVKLPRLPLQPSPPGITFFPCVGHRRSHRTTAQDFPPAPPPAQPHLGGVAWSLPTGEVGTTTVRSIEMYGMVLMAAMSGSADMTEIGHHNRGGCSGSIYSGGCSGSVVVGGGCTGSGMVMGSCHGRGHHHARGNSCHGGGGGLFHRG